MTDDDDAGFLELLKAANEQFQEGGPEEMSCYGTVGYHSFYANNEGPAIGARTALHIALDELLEEMFIDGDHIEERRGEVTPETVAAELDAEFERLGIQYMLAEKLTGGTKRVLREREDRP